jgi:hypothetical protein
MRLGVPILVSLVALADPARAESKTEVLTAPVRKD